VQVNQNSKCLRFYYSVTILTLSRSKHPQSFAAAKGNFSTTSNANAQLLQRMGPGKAIGVIGIPDTVNEARVRTIIPEELVMSKVEMRPLNEGVILEFQNEAVRLPSILSTTDVDRMLVKQQWRSTEPN
jgi:hypothetical protein